MSSLKIYYVEEIDSMYLPVHATIKMNILAAATYLREMCNCDVKEVPVSFYFSRELGNKICTIYILVQIIMLVYLKWFHGWY